MLPELQAGSQAQLLSDVPFQSPGPFHMQRSCHTRSRQPEPQCPSSLARRAEEPPERTRGPGSLRHFGLRNHAAMEDGSDGRLTEVPG